MAPSCLTTPSPAGRPRWRGAGWSVAMATTSSERGLTLRAPGRFTATADRLVELYRQRATGPPRRTPGLRDRVVQGWMEAEAYRAADAPDRHRRRRGPQRRRRQQLREAVVDRARREAQRDGPRHLRPRGRARRAVEQGLAVRPFRADLRGHQRDPAQHRRRARLGLPGSSGPMRFAFTDDQIDFRDAVRDLLAKECAPEVVRAAWPDGTDAHGARKGEGARSDASRVSKVWADLAEMGVLGVGVSGGQWRPGHGRDRLDPPGRGDRLRRVAAPVRGDGLRGGAAARRYRRSPWGLGRTARRLPPGERCPLTSALVPWGDAVTYLVSMWDRGRRRRLGGSPDRGRPRGGGHAGPAHAGRRPRCRSSGRAARRLEVRCRVRHGHRGGAGLRPGCARHGGTAGRSGSPHARPDRGLCR